MGGSWKQFSLHQSSCFGSSAQGPVALQVVSGDKVEIVVRSAFVVSGHGSVVVDGCPASTVVVWVLDVSEGDTSVVLASPL